MRFISAATILLAVCIPAFGQEYTKTFTYTKTKQADLTLVVHYPPGWNETDKRPGIVFFFGGGWENGTIKAFEPQAKYFASRGMVAARADYRVKSRHGVTPKECVDDAREAIRWFRQNAGKLGLDRDRIVASGGSAGGHIAACTTLRPEPGDAAEKAYPRQCLILFNPVLRFGPQMLKKIDNNEAVGKAISPTLHLPRTAHRPCCSSAPTTSRSSRAKSSCTLKGTWPPGRDVHRRETAARILQQASLAGKDASAGRRIPGIPRLS